MKRHALNRNWQFSENNHGFSFSFGNPEWIPVDLPHDYIVNKPRSADAAGGAANGYFGEGQGVYKRDLEVPGEWEGRTLLLDVDGAYMNAEVALNGELLELHPYGYTPFLVDLTPTVRYGKTNKLKIITQSRQPSTRWYTGGGLYRSVSLWEGGPVHIRPWDLFVSTPKVEAEEALVRAEIAVTNAGSVPCAAAVEITAVDPAGRAVGSRTTPLTLGAGDRCSVALELPVKNPALWDLDSPSLYTLRARVLAEGKELDAAEASFGIRSIQVDAERGFRLNGRELKLKGGCIHHDNGFLGACAYPRAEERKLQILRDAGYNAVRISHYPPSLAMLESCDRMGMLLLDEAFDVWRESKVPLDYHLYFEDWWERDITSMVLRDRNHPCVISYSIGNEIGERDGGSQGAAWARRLADKVRSLDSTRFVLSAICGVFPDDGGEGGSNFEANLITVGGETDHWGDSTEEYAAPLDIVGYNYLYERYASDGEKYPGRVICGTETHSFTTYENWQAVLANSHVIGDFIWVAYDYMGEAGVGRVVWNPGEERQSFLGDYPWRTSFQSDHDLCGFRKPQSYFREIMWGHTRRPALFTTHPSRYGQPFTGTGWHWYDVKDTWTFGEEYLGKPVKVDVYAPGGEAEFLLNGKSLGRAPVEKLIATMDVPYQPGTLEAVIYEDGRETGRCSLETAGEAVEVRLSCDRGEIAGDGLDLSFVSIELVDAQGRRVPWQNAPLACRVSGAGVLAGMGSGDPKSEDQYGSGQCLAFEGRAMAVVKAPASGTVLVEVEAEGIGSARLELTAL